MAKRFSFRKLQLESLELRQLMASDLPGVLKPGSFETYSVNGTGNNLAQIEWGSTDEQLLRLASPQYSDGISSPGGTNRPSAREISNMVSDQGSSGMVNQGRMSAFAYAWGQFIDHDLGLTPTGNSEKLSIAIPKRDPYFDPTGTGTKTMSLDRSTVAAGTGTSTSNPRQQLNALTAWLDGSMIYGSDAATAKSLRTMVDGKMKLAGDGMLPLNNSQNFPSGTVPMFNGSPTLTSDQMFAAGEVRANENIELSSLQTLFVREHNRWATILKTKSPSLTDEELYVRARAIVIGELQSITFNEWLPSILGPNAIGPYRGYNPGTNPQLSNEFATAAFRFGHSLLSDEIGFLDSNGNAMAEDVALSDALFNPVLLQKFGLEPILKYLASDSASELDTKAVNSVRNFLFGPPGAGGLDLVSLNIQRGRDHGLASYNAVRTSLGLPKVNGFAEITSDVAMQSKLKTLYGTVDNMDLWVAILAEDHVPGGNLGSTGTKIIASQFERIRNGDRFWYQRSFSGAMLNEIQRTRLSEVIARNTSLKNVQPNVFVFNPRIEGMVIAELPRSNPSGAVRGGPIRPTSVAAPLAGWTVSLIGQDGIEVASTRTDSRGQFRLDPVSGLKTGTFKIQVTKDPVGNGIVRGDSQLIGIQRGDQVVSGVRLSLPLPRGMQSPLAATAAVLRKSTSATDSVFSELGR
ncbi:MAG: peroxidase family protein [Pirellula sp.]